MSEELIVPALQVQVATAFEANEIAISDVKKYCELTVEKHGIGQVTAGRVSVKKLRVAIEHRRKELIETSLQTQRTVNSYAKVLTEQIVPVEEYLQSQEDLHKEAKLKAEKERQAALRAILTERIERLALAGAVAADVSELEAMSDDDFERYLTCETMRVESEREQRELARIAAEKLEADRIAEVERQAEELRIRREEMEAERKALDAEREAIFHQQAIERRQLEEQQAEVRRQQEEIRKEAERKAEAERQRLLVERKAEDERLSQIAAEEAEAARVAHLEALKPEIEKAADFMKAADYWADKKLTDIGRPYWSEFALKKIEEACIEISRHIERG